MSNPDIQYFASSGTWVKPAGAVAVDVMLSGSGTALLLGGFAADEDGSPVAWRYLARNLPGELRVGIARGGEPGNGDRYALFVTHLADTEDKEPGTRPVVARAVAGLLGVQDGERR